MDWLDLLSKASEAGLSLLILFSPLIAKQIVKVLKTREKQKIFDSSILTSYLVVNQISRHTENKIDDKIAEALKILKDSVGQELSEEEKKEATLKLKAIHEAAMFPHLTASLKGILNLKK